MAEHPEVPAPLPDKSPDLADVWQEIEGGIGDRVVFPRMPITDTFVMWPGSDIDGWREFLTVADRAGAGILYVEVSAVPPLPTGGSAAVRAVEVPEHQGQVGRIELGFTHGGLLHIWQADANWADELDAEPDRDDDDGGGGGGGGGGSFQWLRHRDWFDWRDPGGIERLEELLGKDTLAAAVGRCAQLAVAAPYPSRHSLRSLLVDEQPGDTQVREWATCEDTDPDRATKQAASEYVLEQAADAVIVLRRERSRAALSEIGSVFGDLQQFPGWSEARLAGEKKRRIREFVTERLGFYDADVADRLYNVAREARTQPLGQRPLL